MMTPKQQSQPWRPHSYQLRAVRFLLEHGAAALFLDPGLGKTSITLAALRSLFAAKVSKGALVVAPLRVAHNVWPAEVQKWTELSGLKVAVLHGKDKEYLLRKGDADVYVINYEGLQWLLRADNAKRLFQLVDTLIVDELAKMKHPRSVRFRALRPVLNKFARRWGLTGSPAANGLLDLFGQVFILDQGRALGSYITHYRANYFMPTGFGGFTWVPKPGAEEAIHEALRPLALRLAAEDYLELPERVVQNIYVTLPPDARAAYDSMEDEFFAELESGDVDAVNAAAASGKLRQISNGGVYDSAGDAAHLHDEKTNALRDLVDDLQGQQLLIAYEFKHDLARLRKAFGDKLEYIGGGVGTKETQRIEAAWNAGELQLLAGHPAAIGHGLNLQGSSAAHVAWYSLTWDYELYDQFVRRVYRQGNRASHVFVYHVLARDTVDEAVYRALGSKRRVQGALLDALKERRRSAGKPRR